MDKLYSNPEVWGGIECTINRVRDNFYDQLQFSGHYERESDLELIASLGIKKLRYPILWERHQNSKGEKADFEEIGRKLEKIRSFGIEPIAGLVHHGSGPAFTNLADPDFAELLASYALQVAKAFPWIKYWTPVNEPLTTARFSGLYGLWYPHSHSTKQFVHMLLNQLKGVSLSMQQIRKIIPDAKLVQTEDLGKVYSTPELAYQAEFENHRRWLTFDFLGARMNKSHPLWNRLRRLGIPEKDLLFFENFECTPDIFGFNHYLTSERYLDHRLERYPAHTHGGNGKHRYADVEAVRVNFEEEIGLSVLLKEAWERYHKPIAITEVHLHCHREEQLRWFRYVWNTSCDLRQKGIDLQAVTSWALLGSHGWNKLLTAPPGEYEPGAFDLRNSKPRPTALTHFIRTIAQQGACADDLSKAPGWWEHPGRLIYSPVKRKVVSMQNQKPFMLVIGKNGTLGSAFGKICSDRNIPFRLLSRQDCDISKPEEIENVIGQFKPSLIINTAGFVRVDDAEKEPGFCYRDNHLGPINLATSCLDKNIHLVNFSTDLVFDGAKTNPYVESDEVNPLNVYGKSKAESEIEILKLHSNSLIVRTSAFFGPWDQYNFAHFIINELADGREVEVMDDYIISPTYVPHLVHAVLDLSIDRESGIWHLANNGAVSWFEFAMMICKKAGLDSSLLIPKKRSELSLPAPRPAYSVLGSERGQILPTLETALNQYFEERTQMEQRVA